MQKLSINSIEKHFCHDQGLMQVLGPLNLEILPGEFVCILGESGCGKSTLWRILAGLEAPSAGKLLLDEQAISGTDYRRGVVFQNPALLPWLTVEENVALGFKIRGKKVPKQAVRDTIKLVGIDGFENVKPKKLSGGMAQRAAIARALVSNPDVLLMDEPFAALDAVTRLRMQEALLDIWQRQSITVVFITHDIDEAMALASRVVIMTPRPGRIAATIDIPLSHPRMRADDEFLHLRGLVADELVKSFKKSPDRELICS
ncbi:MAG: ABC transporter ATP-binding protein [Candidatus Obscuribacterales bacterium]|nr:ABC transporter ATP-binding protein [Candidatus Obscuribacterales bacterium]